MPTATSTIARAVVDAVLSVTGGPEPHHPPAIEKDDVVAVMAQLRDLGSYDHMNAFEGIVAAACGQAYAVATASGTAALEVALATLGVGPGDRVAVPALSFVAAANAVRHRGAVPVFVDVESRSLGMSPAALSRVLEADDIKAIIVVHMLGHPCEIYDLQDISIDAGVPLIEDAAEALGSRYGANPCGGFGAMSILSFNINKIVTTGGGGSILTSNSWLHERARHLATTARVKDPPWEVAHDAVAWNGRMSMLAAALGHAQASRLKDLVQAKRALAAAYREAFSRVDGVMFRDEPPGATSNYWLPSIVVHEDDRVAVLTALNEAGLGCRALFTPLDHLGPYRREPKCLVADACYRTEVCLPGGVGLARRFT